MVLDLTLNAIQIPGLPTFSRIFGTKKANGVGLTTAEVNQNMLAPWNRQRPYTVAENSSTGVVEADACIVVTPGCSTLTLGNGAFTGVRVLIINTGVLTQLITTKDTGYILPYQTIEVMWFGDCWYLCDGHMVGEIINAPFQLVYIPYGYLDMNKGLRPSRTAYARLMNTILDTYSSSFTCTTATPTVCSTISAHGFVGGERLRLSTTGSLTGATLSQDYFVEVINATTFYLNTAEGGTTRLAITAQSGTHTFTVSAYGVGDGSTTFDLPDVRQTTFVGAGTGTTHNVASVDTFLRGQWKNYQLEWHGHDIQASDGTGGSELLLGAGAGGPSRLANYTFPIGARLIKTDGVHGTPNSGSVTRGKSLGTNYLIKY